MRFRVIGGGRAGSAFRRALATKGWVDCGVLGRADDPVDAAADVDVVLLTVPDRAISSVAAAVRLGPAAVVHTSGATSLEALAPHPRRASVHPLVSLPDPATGAERLASGATFAVAGDPVATSLVSTLGGTAIEVADEVRPLYHAAASVAANHLVALCAQVERLADRAGVPHTAYWQLMTSTLDNVMAADARTALTGPAARGDLTTIAAHLAAMDQDERSLYLAMADAAAALAEQPLPSSLIGLNEDERR